MLIVFSYTDAKNRKRNRTIAGQPGFLNVERTNAEMDQQMPRLRTLLPGRTDIKGVGASYAAFV